MSGSTTWQRASAWTGGTVAALALSPTFAQDGLILAATAAGLYRSVDGGAHWQRDQNGLLDPRITAVVFAPAQPIAFAATADGRLFQAQAGGATWQEITTWAGLGVISAITLSPNFAHDQTIFLATPEGIFRSQDGGRTWESSTFGLLDLEILCLACAPNFAESELLWAGSALGGLYRSRNGAHSWRDTGQGLPDMAIQCMAVSPTFAQDQTLYVGTESDGVYYSTDGGANWQPCGGPLAGQPINALALGSHSQTLVAGTGEGIYRSLDGGHTWHLTDGSLLALSLALAPDGTVLAGTYQEGVFHLPVATAQWELMSAGLAAHVPPTALRDSANTLYLLDVEGALVASADAGQTWQSLNHVFAQEPVCAAALSVNEQATQLYVATAQALYVATGSGPDPAWSSYPLPDELITPALLACSSTPGPTPLLIVGDETGNLYRSADQGEHWQLLAVPWQQRQLVSLLISPLDRTDQTLYVLTAQPDPAKGYLMQLWQTINNGTDWQVLVDFYADTPAAAMTLPLDPAEQPILVGVRNRLIKIYQQADLAWAADQQFLDDALRITSIVTTARYIEERAIYVTTNGGVLQTVDTGATWTPVGAGLADRTIVAFWPGTPDQPASAVELGGTLWQLAA